MTAHTNTSASRFAASHLTDFAAAVFAAAGMPADRARAVADILVEGDLLGHDTHGLDLLSPYVADLEAGRMKASGDPVVVSERAAVLAWEALRLPGPWIVLQAIARATERATACGTGTVSVRHGYHIGCLATYARRVAEQGLVLMLHSSAPAGASVAPYGGTRALFSPSPIAVGIPTSSDPIVIDVSTSITTNNLTARLYREGAKLAAPWLIDESGAPTDDPGVLVAPRKGTILPVGGIDAGHKGYGLSLMVEALTAGLAGHGRSDPGERFGATVFVQVIDPEAFSGLAAFREQMDWIAAACHDNPPARGVERVRVPGERALALRREQLERGVALRASIVAALTALSGKYGVPLPARR